MSQQTLLDSYFKAKAGLMLDLKPEMNKIKKRRSLSLKKCPRPSKTPKKDSQDNVAVADDYIVVLSSDSEIEHTPSRQHHVDSNDTTNSSHDTIIYSLSPRIKTQATPRASNIDVEPFTQRITVRKDLLKQFDENGSNNNGMSTPKTPSKTPQSKKSSGKYYSPTKKRVVMKQTPTKRNFARQLFNVNVEATEEDNESGEEFLNACEGLDDKTIFLLSIIKDYLKKDALRSLLDDNSQELLAASMHVVKPGMRLVCRLYWCLPGWYRKEKLAKICDDKAEKTSTEKKKSPGDISKMNDMLQSLVDTGFLVCSTVEGEDILEFDDYMKLLLSTELLKISKYFKRNATTKEEAVRALRIYSSSTVTIDKFFKPSCDLKSKSGRVMTMLRQVAGPCYQLSALARSTLDKLYVLMYLGMDYGVIRDKKLELKLLNEKTHRETYPIDKTSQVDDASVVFRNKDEFNRYYQAHKMYEEFLAMTVNTNKMTNFRNSRSGEAEPGITMELKQIVLDAYENYKTTGDEEMLRYKSLPPWLRRFTPTNIYVKIMEYSIKELKKDRTCITLAVNILKCLIDQNEFRSHRKHEWWAERALILHKHLNKPERAAKILIRGLKSNISEEAKDWMRPRALKIAQQLNIELTAEIRQELLKHATKSSITEKNHASIHICKHPIDNYNNRGKLMFEVRTANERYKLSAEDYCILHLKSQGIYTHGQHWEGRIVTTMFSLLFWDVIYMRPQGVRGVFLSYYQHHPLDMFSDCFYTNRKEIIDERLAFIEESSDDILVNIMQEKWEERPEHEISDIQRSVGLDNIKMVVECLGARAVAAVCRRLALCYGYAHSGFPDLTMWNIHTKKVTFIEVKTDADQPSIKQLQWMDYLKSCEIEAKFCYVGANTTRQRSRPGPDLIDSYNLDSFLDS